jgi:thioredoxin 1
MQTTPKSKTMYGQVLHANSQDFAEQVLKADSPVLVDFYADWCAPCRMLSPVLDQLARETPEAKIVKVNVDQSPDIASQYKVNSIPMLILFDEGKPNSHIIGMAPKQAIQRMLASGTE